MPAAAEAAAEPRVDAKGRTVPPVIRDADIEKSNGIAQEALDHAKAAIEKITKSGIINADLMLAKAKLHEAVSFFERTSRSDNAAPGKAIRARFFSSLLPTRIRHCGLHNRKP